MTAVLVAAGVLALPAVDSIVTRARQAHAYRRGWSCLSHRRCSEGHTYRRGCLLRPPKWQRGSLPPVPTLDELRDQAAS